MRQSFSLGKDGDILNKISEYRVDFAREEETKAEEKEKLTFGEIVLEVIDSAKTAIIIVLLLFTFVFRAVGVDGDSMQPTCSNGDWLIVSAFVKASGPERGDIVIITQPWKKNVPLIKRVIAVEGDLVNIDFGAGIVFVNGERLEESYIKEPTHLCYDVEFPLVVPEGKVFVMGDNRNDSLDSRSSSIGFIDEDYILGKALIRLFPAGNRKLYGEE